MPKKNKVVRIALMGGLLGALLTNPRRALDDKIDELNVEGWNCHQIITHSTSNLFVRLLQIAILLLTFGIWTFGAGYILLMEKEVR